MGALVMTISNIIMWTFVFIIATGFVTIISTAVLMKRARRHPDEPQSPQNKVEEDDWKKGDWKD